MNSELSREKKNAKKSGWRRMQEIAGSNMKEKGYNIEDVRKDLKEIRSTYKDY